MQRFGASVERVFDAWLDPALISQWMFGPSLRDEEIVSISVDARRGGRFSFVVRRGGQELEHAGEYLEFERPRRLVFTRGVPSHSPDSARVTVEITSLGAGCELTLTHELHPNWADFAARTQQGWAKMLARLAEVFGEAAG